ncbi:Type IV secretory pathway VirB3 family protein [Paraburkholderia piptadeniae]|uniref:Type VI secretion protein n=2 Tax=Paraburkholderia TaxID=1822464 RepID=A0A7X1NH15_9BURK|nr:MULTISPECIES: VirB3 family type IV secretion system protein [Paraburkholderia]MPW21739.1 type VI secretion protein [Paraburkholderia franconis]SIT51778.1 Type IV secretory pathway VirB3 family protein [Paraburkholderia piptadeniae]
MSDEKARYAGFNGLGRTAAIWGVPYMAMLVVVVASMFTGVLVAFFVGPGGLLFVFLGFPVLLSFKHICETDDQGLWIMWLQFRCRFYFWQLRIRARVNAGRAAPHFGNTSTLAPLRYGRQRRVFRDFLQPLGKGERRLREPGQEP